MDLKSFFAVLLLMALAVVAIVYVKDTEVKVGAVMLFIAASNLMRSFLTKPPGGGAGGAAVLVLVALSQTACGGMLDELGAHERALTVCRNEGIAAAKDAGGDAGRAAYEACKADGGL